MSQWSRKKLDVLRYSVDEELKSLPNLDHKTWELFLIAHRISKSVRKSEEDLKQCRSHMCEVCRGHQMYTCDVPVGWSPNCAFIRKHGG
jgi:hypothetical protein